MSSRTFPPLPPRSAALLLWILVLALGFQPKLCAIAPGSDGASPSQTQASTVPSAQSVPAQVQAFVHPGGLHTQADLDRMKAKVVAHESPWIECWDKLSKDPLAQASYRAGATGNLGDRNGGAGRQRASRDAHAAYLNFLRWYIGGDQAHAECAIRICNDWSAAVNQIPSGSDIPGLSGIPISELAMAGELLRGCPLWKPEDQERFKRMMRDYFYPQVHDYLAFKNKTGDNHAWANWDICNIQALLAMGVLLDDRAIFDEGVEYFKNGRGTGSLPHALYYRHSGNLGQWQESGRDQGHAQLGVGMLGQACQIAWNQGVDLFSFADNGLLAGAEYVGGTALGQNLPYKFYTNSGNANNYWIANNNGGGRIGTPVWELLYNHYVVRCGLKAPNVTALAKLARPEGGGGDHFGYGSLTFTLDAAASPYPPLQKPAAPVGLTASPGLRCVHLSWQVAANADANGFLVRRARGEGTSGFETIATWTGNTTPLYTDTKAEPGVTYRYVVAACNQAGESPDSAPATAAATAPAPLPAGWVPSCLGEDAGCRVKGTFSEADSGTFVIQGLGQDLGGIADNASFVGRKVAGDFVFVGRLTSPGANFVAHTEVSKVGLMIRESLASGAPSASVTLGEAGLRGTRARFRAEAGKASRTENGNDYTWAPIWYRLERRAGTFTASHSTDGMNWFDIGSAKIPMPAEALAGFVLCTGNSKKAGVAIFDHVSIRALGKP